ncbi:hypothetical protein AB0M28_30760 [Streptomyces sp. NPDC051940]|uniref:hypothetical protein n=1 Tax=Streptomyces sp. NPDC051940 TaxID=3155675 RepID=UPI003438A123
MAVRKSKMQEQVAESIKKTDPGARPVVTVYSVTGPTPWFTGSFGLLGQLFVKYYFITVTEQSVIIHGASVMTGRPTKVAHAIDRQEAKDMVSEVRRAKVYSSFRMRLPGQAKPTRINVHRVWRPEMDRLLTELGTPTAA